MRLIDESYSSNKSSKTILIAGIAGIVVLVVIIISLLLFVLTINGNKPSLTVNNVKATECLYQKDNVTYVSIEDLAGYLGDGYSYKNGTKTGEDENKCYVTNSNLLESTFFEVGSDNISKVSEDTNETEYFKIDNAIIKENGKIYMPMNSVNVALNAIVTSNKKKYAITSVEAQEAKYNKTKSKSFVPDESIVWNTLPANKKLLKNDLVIIQDSTGLLGVGKVSLSSNSKTKVTTVTTDNIIDPKYDYIKYVEKYNYLIVEAKGKRGIIKLNYENDNYSKSTLVALQYEDIKPIKENLFLVSTTATEKTKKYGLIFAENNTEELVLPIEYDRIGIDISSFTNNNITDGYIVYSNLIPVQKGNLWGFVNVKGKVIVKPEYTGIGCIGTNTDNNVLIIPDIEGIVVQKDGKYGIITKTNRVLIKNTITRIYKGTVNGVTQYLMELNGKEYNVVDYIKNPSKYQNK